MPPLTPQLGLFDPQVVRSAKLQKITEWPEQLRFPINFDKNKVEDIVLNDIRLSTSPLIITGFTSLDYLIDFVAELDAEHTQYGDDLLKMTDSYYHVLTANASEEQIFGVLPGRLGRRD